MVVESDWKKLFLKRNSLKGTKGDGIDIWTEGDLFFLSVI